MLDMHSFSVSKIYRQMLERTHGKKKCPTHEVGANEQNHSVSTSSEDLTNSCRFLLAALSAQEAKRPKAPENDSKIAII